MEAEFHGLYAMLLVLKVSACLFELPYLLEFKLLNSVTKL